MESVLTIITITALLNAEGAIEGPHTAETTVTVLQDSETCHHAASLAEAMSAEPKGRSRSIAVHVMASCATAEQ